jgi:hypothetical protein
MGHSRTPTQNTAGDGFPADRAVGRPYIHASAFRLTILMRAISEGRAGCSGREAAFGGGLEFEAAIVGGGDRSDDRGLDHGRL